MPAKPKVRQIALTSIVIETPWSLSSRQPDADTVERYKERIEAGDEFPPIVLYEIDGQLLLAAGQHRCAAYAEAGHKEVAAEVRQGTIAEATLFSIRDNATHGRPLTNAQKREACALALKVCPNDSSRKIAAAIGVGHDLVESVRSSMPQLADSASSPRVGADGKTRRLPPKAPPPPADDFDLDDLDPDGPEETPSDQGGIEPDDPSSDTDDQGGTEAPPATSDALALAACQQAEKAMRDAIEVLAEFERTEGSAWLPRVSGKSQIRIALEKARGDLRSCRPSGQCGKCDGGGCDHCRQTGWLPKYMTTKNAQSARE